MDIGLSLATQRQERLYDLVRRRRYNDKAIIETPLAHLNDEELLEDVEAFAARCLPDESVEGLRRAARVAKDMRLYDTISRDPDPNAGSHFPVQLTREEKEALVRERDVFLEWRMFWVIFTVSLAAFLQGFVQSSINSASQYSKDWGLDLENNQDARADYRLGAANASPYLFAAVLGCPLAFPVNYRFGRRGGMAIASLLIFASSLGSAFVESWQAMFAVRIINGIGMGMKAVSTPILASETAVGFWRGSSILAWQLWVAFGIMVGLALNIAFRQAKGELASGLILGAPMVPALILFVVTVWLCPESPRYLLRTGPNYNPPRALSILVRLRRTRLQALRDIYLIYKSIELENYAAGDGEEGGRGDGTHAMSTWETLKQIFVQHRELLLVRRLRNALISSSVVALCQQLCGINLLAFYSGFLFDSLGAGDSIRDGLSFGFGLVNFLFALPAIRTIDTLGRRKWLLLTLPGMTATMAAASASNHIPDESTRLPVVAFWLFLFAALYSPGLGPIPFTLASESFPLSHREVGASCAIAVNLGFAGILGLFVPPVNNSIGPARVLGLFSGFNGLCFVLVFFLVEETKRRSLEDLDLVFAVSKLEFMKFQVKKYLPWFARRYILFKKAGNDKPSLYVDEIWDTLDDGTAGSGDEEQGHNVVEVRHGGGGVHY